MTRHQRVIQLNGERENNIVQAEQREEKEMTRHQRAIQLNGERENNIVQAEQREEKEMTRHQRVIQLNGERENNIVQAEQREEKEMTRVSVALMNQGQTGMMEVNTYLHHSPRTVKTGAMKVQICQKTEKLKEYYRLTENTLQLAKMSKLLMAIECGTTVYKGKSLDEIDLGLEVALSEKRKQGCTSDHVMMETSEQEEDELSRSQKKRPDPGDSCDSDELSKSQKKRPDPDESCDSDGKGKVDPSGESLVDMVSADTYVEFRTHDFRPDFRSPTGFS
ncbi:alpha-(1,3)-fucosyltransferase 7-like protein [Labeo rohita]|uniref:Alpha-(1,3)-fucosyltransferase 7-like protein n=1 Tax=Labeo rohita TaxID=84645 RepID=A0A498MHY7_LABRO|nr:alpha-(1,3)-fucosyltransferase 7-like protein [Labeo rohita]